MARVTTWQCHSSITKKTNKSLACCNIAEQTLRECRSSLPSYHRTLSCPTVLRKGKKKKGKMGGDQLPNQSRNLSNSVLIASILYRRDGTVVPTLGIYKHTYSTLRLSPTTTPTTTFPYHFPLPLSRTAFSCTSTPNTHFPQPPLPTPYPPQNPQNSIHNLPLPVHNPPCHTIP